MSVTPTFYQAVPFTLPVSLLDAIGHLLGFAAQPVVTYDFVLEQVNYSGSVVADLTPYALKSGASIQYDSTTSQHGTLTVSLQKEMNWGADLLRPAMLISSPGWNGGVAVKFIVGVYVATVAPLNLQENVSVYQVTGYDKEYLLQGQIPQSFNAVSGSLYIDALTTLFQQAGVLASGSSLASVAAFPPDWAAKTLAVDSTYLLGSGSTIVGVTNDLLKASGMHPIHTDNNGKFIVDNLPDPTAQPSLWTFAGGLTDFTPGGFPYNSVVLDANRTGGRDAWNVPNYWRFIQNGLAFAPTVGDGEYDFIDTANYAAVGRYIYSTTMLDASGQADLETQAKAIIVAQSSMTEKLSIQTVPWPVAGYYDIFTYTDPNLPGSPMRKVQVQQWTLPLNGDPMSWSALVVTA